MRHQTPKNPTPRPRGRGEPPSFPLCSHSLLSDGSPTAVSRRSAGLRTSKMSIVDAKTALATARDAGVLLSSVSQELVATEDESAAQLLVAEQKDLPLSRPTVCTCMEVRGARRQIVTPRQSTLTPSVA
eukprot:3324259-Prymnesium_polylepis.4